MYGLYFVSNDVKILIKKYDTYNEAYFLMRSFTQCMRKDFLVEELIKKK